MSMSLNVNAFLIKNIFHQAKRSLTIAFPVTPQSKAHAFCRPKSADTGLQRDMQWSTLMSRFIRVRWFCIQPSDQKVRMGECVTKQILSYIRKTSACLMQRENKCGSDRR